MPSVSRSYFFALFALYCISDPFGGVGVFQGSGISTDYWHSSYSSYYSGASSFNPYALGWGYDDDANSYGATTEYSNL